uniref:Uncharacterized protein n=1 Tax=Knipowitschia caucasica TaxID=637954 RepID=A0AAV2LKV7_KNICA
MGGWVGGWWEYGKDGWVGGGRGEYGRMVGGRWDMEMVWVGGRGKVILMEEGRVGMGVRVECVGGLGLGGG